MYTNDLSKSNQLACSFFDLERLFAYDEHVYWPIRDGFFQILPEVSDPWCCTKRIVASGNKIGYTPIYFKGYATVPMLYIF